MATKLGDIQLEKKSGTTLTLGTENKYVNDNVSFNLSVIGGTAVANIASADVEVQSDASGRNISDAIGAQSPSAPSSGYYLKVQASGSGSSQVTSAGWIAAGVLPAASTTATKYYPIDTATVTQNAPTVDDTGLVTATTTTTAGYTPARTTASSNTFQLPTQSGTTVSPTDQEQTIVSAGKYTTGAIKVAPIAAGSVTPAINSHSIISPVVTPSTTGTITDISTTTKPSGTDGTAYWTITPSGSTKTVGKSTANAKATVEAGYIGTSPANSDDDVVNISPTIEGGAARYIVKGTAIQNAPTVDTTTGVVTATSTITAGYQGASAPSETLSLPTQAGATITPTESEQTAVAANKYTLGAVKVGAISPSYVGSNVPRKTSENLSVEENVVTAPAGYYAEDASATVPVGTVTSGTATISSVSVSAGTNASKFSLSGSTNVSAPTIGTAGYVSSDKGTKNARTGGATLNATVNKIVGTATISETLKKPVISKQNVPSGVTNAASGSATTTAPSSGVYVAVKSAANTETITPVVSITTEGYGTNAKHGIAATGASVGASDSDMTYVPITTTAASLNGDTVTYGTGWITGGSKVVTAGTVTSGSITISSLTKTYDSGTGKFNVSSSAAVPAPSIDTAGYVSDEKGTKNAGTATVQATLDKVALQASSSSAFTKTPSIKRKTFTISNVTDASSGAETTTAPTSGVYVKVKSDANTAQATINPSVKTEGYGTTSQYTATPYTPTVGATASADTYIPIKTGSATTPATTITSSPSISIDSDGLITATNSKTQSVTPTVSAGYVLSGTAGTVTVNGSNTKQMTVKGVTTWTPTTSDQSIASGTYLTGTQTIKGDADLVAANIKKGVDIFGVIGTYTSDATASAEYIYHGKTAYVNGSKITGIMPDVNPSETTTTVSGTTANRGTWTQAAGFTSARTIGAATFANSATSGKSYVNISNTTAAPVLVSGDYLYINKGWTDDLKISLAKLVPDGSDVKGHGEYILSGHSAYDDDGTLIAGTIPTIASTDLTVEGKTVTVPVGFYTGASGATAASANVAVGTVTSGTASITSVSVADGTDASKFSLSGSADVSAPSVGTAGYISSSEGTRNKKTGGATLSATVNKIVGTASISATTKKPSITKQNVPSGVTQAASGDATTTAPSSGVYVAVKSAANTTTLTPTVTISTSGYGTNSKHGITASGASVGAAASDITYIPITTTSASLSGRTVSYGSGWITAGNIEVPVGSVKSGSASITSVSVSDGSDASKFVLSGSANVSAPSVTTAGYISSDEGTRSTNNGGATLSATVNKIVGTASISATTKKPSITKQDVPSGVTQAASGNATTTAPSSGVYVAVKSAANTATLTPTVSITTSGYGTSTKHGITASGASVGAAASDTTYIPIATTSATVNGKTVSYGSGWITAGSSSVADGSVTPAVNSHTITAPIVACKTTGTGASLGTTTQPSGTDGTDYWTFTPSADGTKGSSVTNAKATVVAGYIATSPANSGNSTKDINTTINNGTTRYIPKAAIAGSSTNATATTTVAPGTVSISKQSTPSGVTNAASGNATTTAPSSGVYVAVKATAAANTTGTTSAISGSGTATVTTAGYAPTSLTGTVSVSGTATAKTSAKDSSITYVPITTASPTFSSPTPTGGSTAVGTNCTIGSSNTSGISIQTKYSVNAASFTYNAAVNGWVTKTNGASAGSTTARSSTNGTNYYLTGAALTKPSSGTRSFTVTAPDASNVNHTYTFTTDTTGRTTIQIDSALTVEWNATDESLDFVYS